MRNSANPGPVLEGQKPAEELSSLFSGLALGVPLKGYGDHNPIMTYNFGADPWALVYEGRVYLYLTGDGLQYNEGGLVAAAYSGIRCLRVLSSADLANWTCHGDIKTGGPGGLTPWANNGEGNAWAPAAAYKMRGGRAEFFLYWADNSRGICVLTADSPTGPWRDPLGRYLVSRDTPGCSEGEVVWLFDPAVLTDDDGSAYLYFGGGVDGKPAADPGTGRVVKLGDDMISLAEDPLPLPVPYLFEDSGINKIGDTYYYSYCTNWGTGGDTGGNALGIGPSQIAYMTGPSPYGPFTFRSKILDSPASMFSGTIGSNNHHCMFEFKGAWYIAYHTQTLERAMKDAGILPEQAPHPVTGALQADMRCRNPHIDEVTVNPDGTIAQVTGSMAGVGQVGYLDPYLVTGAETMGVMAGICVKEDADASSGVAVAGIDSGDWLALYGVDFGGSEGGGGARRFFCRVKAPQDGLGAIQVKLDSLDGPAAGYVSIKLAEGVSERAYSELTVDLPKPITGVHDLIFVFYGEGWEFDEWGFGK